MLRLRLLEVGVLLRWRWGLDQRRRLMELRVWRLQRPHAVQRNGLQRRLSGCHCRAEPAVLKVILLLLLRLLLNLKLLLLLQELKLLLLLLLLM